MSLPLCSSKLQLFLGQIYSFIRFLIRKRELLSPDELELDWKPMYNLYEKTIYASKVYFVPEGFESSLKSLIRCSRVYFPIHCTQDILDEFRYVQLDKEIIYRKSLFRPYLCPFDVGMSKGLNYLELFLPTVVRKPDEINQGFKLWLDELMTIWDCNPNSPSWEQNLLWLFSRVAHDSIGLIDWTPWIPKIFTHLIKSFGLQGGTHKVNVI